MSDIEDATPVEKILDLSLEQVNEIIRLRRDRPLGSGTAAAHKARAVLAATGDTTWAHRMGTASGIASRASRQVDLRNPANTITLQVSCEDYVTALMARERLTDDEFQLLVYPVASLISPTLVSEGFVGRLKEVSVVADAATVAQESERRAESARTAGDAKKGKRKPRAPRTPEATTKAVTTRRANETEKKTGMSQKELKDWF